MLVPESTLAPLVLTQVALMPRLEVLTLETLVLHTLEISIVLPFF